MKILPFITELVEARMFFGPKDLKNMSADKIAEIVFLMFMMIEVIRQYRPDYASIYATDTLKYNTYENMNYAGTDLSNLLAVLNNQDTFKAYIKSESGVAIPLYQINRYLRGVISKSSSGHSEDVTFFWRLEDYLKLYSNSLLRQLRRDIGSWKDLTLSNKEQIYLILRREFDKRASSADIYLWYKSSFKITEDVAIKTKVESVSPIVAETKSFLAELADAPYKFDISPKFTGHNADGYTFTTDDGIKYLVGIRNAPVYRGKKNALNVNFLMIKTPTSIHHPELSQEIENTGDAYRIFATVKEIVRLTLDKFESEGRPVGAIYFSSKANSPSRNKLYDRFAKSFGRYFPDFVYNDKLTIEPGLNTWEIVRHSTKSPENKATLYNESDNLNKTGLDAIIKEAEETERLDIEETGSWSQRVFFNGFLQEKRKGWLDRLDEKDLKVESTLDLMPDTGTAYLGRIDAYPMGNGFGTEMISYIVQQCRIHGFYRINAYIERQNYPSQSAVRKSGFKEVEQRKEGSVWELIL